MKVLELEFDTSMLFNTCPIMSVDMVQTHFQLIYHKPGDDQKAWTFQDPWSSGFLLCLAGNPALVMKPGIVIILVLV